MAVRRWRCWLARGVGAAAAWMAVRRVGLMRRWRSWRGWWSVARWWRRRHVRRGSWGRVSRWRREGDEVGVEVAASKSGVLRTGAGEWGGLCVRAKGGVSPPSVQNGTVKKKGKGTYLMRPAQYGEGVAFEMEMTDRHCPTARTG
ncbi:hypothetical protein EDB84DRAFT_1190248 [Lactarius hengduanensis]|nr:hypothetical protein EDB84DRAFT_1190248 [Lactarius hengduanensis]